MRHMPRRLPRPGNRGKTVVQAETHQLVVSRVEAHFVDAVAIAVMRFQHGQAAIGLYPPFDRFTAATYGAKL